MNYEQLRNIISIPADEKDAFKKLIQTLRGKLISSPSDIVNRAFEIEHESIKNITTHNNVSEVVHILRERAYSEFLVEESDFNVEVLRHISDELETPSAIFDIILAEKLNLSDLADDVIAQIKEISIEYSGRISPYIYELCLSNTNSRRSRAGKTFEAVIYKLYETFGYTFDSQKAVGKQTFAKHGLGKMVDSILPGVECFGERRDKVIIGTMKTTLRERWQEVVEELQRTGVPSIHLLTMDDDISENKAIQMAKHNMIVVVPKEVKESCALKDMRNFISFETYFLEEIPELIRYWKR